MGYCIPGDGMKVYDVLLTLALIALFVWGMAIYIAGWLWHMNKHAKDDHEIEKELEDEEDK